MVRAESPQYASRVLRALVPRNEHITVDRDRTVDRPRGRSDLDDVARDAGVRVDECFEELQLARGLAARVSLLGIHGHVQPVVTAVRAAVAVTASRIVADTASGRDTLMACDAPAISRVPREPARCAT
jgi:hypothetical protein